MNRRRRLHRDAAPPIRRFLGAIALMKLNARRRSDSRRVCGVEAKTIRG
jgi:hypothetical protein